MSIRIAVATTDGKTVNEHFGRASVFHILSLDEKTHCLLEKRESQPVRGNFHDHRATEATVALLDDCRAVLASKVGPGAKRALALRDISVFEIDLSIDEAIDRLRGYYYGRRQPVFRCHQ